MNLIDYLSRLKIRDLRCVESAEVEFCPGWNYVVGGNAQGKSSLLEAAYILLRLQSPRARRLGDVLRHGAKGLVVDGYCRARHLQFYYSPDRRKLALDSVEQRTAAEYLSVGGAVFFSNSDLELVRGGAEVRRRYMDLAAAQVEPGYRAILSDYDKALRSRNRALRQGPPGWKQADAFLAPLLRSGILLAAMRVRTVARLAPQVAAAYAAISGVSGEVTQLGCALQSSVGDDYGDRLRATRDEDRRLAQTQVGPHRDEIMLALDGHTAVGFGSEGQQRSIALALRVGQSRLIEEVSGRLPVLLLDDIFGELDPARREALLAVLPGTAQKLVASTSLDWLPGRPEGEVWSAHRGTFSKV